MNTIETGDELYFRLVDAEDDRWRAWVMEQPRAQRPYIRHLRSSGKAYAFAAYFNARDHILLLADAFDQPRNGMRIWSYLSLARGALEALVRVAVLNDRSTMPARQLLQSAAAVVDGSEEQILLAKDVSPETVKVAQRQLDSEKRRCTRAGIEIVLSSRGRARRLTRDGTTVNAAMDVTGETGKRLQGVPGPYRIGSAAAHSGAWFLTSAMGDEGEFGPRADPDIIIVAAMMPVYAHLAAVEAVARELDGEEVQQYRRSIERQVRRVLIPRQRHHPPAVAQQRSR